MGALIRTKGTKLLAAHFNEEFSTYIDFYRKPKVAALFNTKSDAYTSLLDITNQLRDPADSVHAPRPDHKCLLPYLPEGTRHRNLEARWLWFLNTASSANGSLTAANDKKIANGIYKALTDMRGKNPKYNNITFDAVQTDGKQNVSARATKDDGTVYMQVLLMTPRPMPDGTAALIGGPTPPPLDSPND